MELKRLAVLLALLVALDAATTLYALSTGRFYEAGILASRLIPVLGPLYFALVEYPVLLGLAVLGRRAPVASLLLEAIPVAVASLAIFNNILWIGGYMVSGSP